MYAHTRCKFNTCTRHADLVLDAPAVMFQCLSAGDSKVIAVCNLLLLCWIGTHISRRI